MENVRKTLTRKYSQPNVRHSSSSSIDSNNRGQNDFLTPIDVNSTLRRRSNGFENLSGSSTVKEECDSIKVEDSTDLSSDPQSFYKVS